MPGYGCILKMGPTGHVAGLDVGSKGNTSVKDGSRYFWPEELEG